MVGVDVMFDRLRCRLLFWLFGDFLCDGCCLCGSGRCLRYVR